MEKPIHSILAGALLIAGTCIGGGMLALPVATSLAGFVPSLVVFFLCYAFMACTALLMAEVCLFMPGDTNIVSMTEKTLGSVGKACAWGLYLFLFYCLTIAYVTESGNLVKALTGGEISSVMGTILFVILFAPFVYIGAAAVEGINVFLMSGLFISYFAFVVIGAPHVDVDLLVDRDWSQATFILPISFTAFAYQGIIPTLTRVMNREVRTIRWAILIGSTIPLIFYVIWQWLIQGIIPAEGAEGLVAAKMKGINAVTPLRYALQEPKVFLLAQYFAFFAVVTSFLGVTLGLRDFLSDGLRIKRNRLGRFSLCLMIFIPPVCVSFVYPNIFLSALSYAGGIGCALLLGLIPILMAWVVRYRLRSGSPHFLGGGRVVLVVLLLFVLFELGCQVAYSLH